MHTFPSRVVTSTAHGFQPEKEKKKNWASDGRFLIRHHVFRLYRCPKRFDTTVWPDRNERQSRFRHRTNPKQESSSINHLREKISNDTLWRLPRCELSLIFEFLISWKSIGKQILFGALMLGTRGISTTSSVNRDWRTQKLLHHNELGK